LIALEDYQLFFLTNDESAETADIAEDPPNHLSLEKSDNLHWASLSFLPISLTEQRNGENNKALT
jgi:hypothetical protein